MENNDFISTVHTLGLQKHLPSVEYSVEFVFPYYLLHLYDVLDILYIPHGTEIGYRNHLLEIAFDNEDLYFFPLINYSA